MRDKLNQQILAILKRLIDFEQYYYSFSYFDLKDSSMFNDFYIEVQNLIKAFENKSVKKSQIS